MEKSKTLFKYPSVKLPHTKEEVRKYGNYEISPSALPPVENADTSWNVETANMVNDMSEAVDLTHVRTLKLGQRVGGLENKVKDIEKSGVIMYDSCVRGKKLPGLQPRPSTPADENEALIEKLNGKLKVCNLQLVRQRNAIKKLQDENQFCKRLVRQEVGEEFNRLDPALKFKNFGGWKGRAQIIISLRAKIVELEHQVEECHHRLRHNENENVYDPIRKHHPEILVPKYQRAAIDKIYMRQYDKYRFREQDMYEVKGKCKELSLICSSMAARNNTLTKNVKDMKQKNQTLEQKSTKDNELIRSLLLNQNTLKDILETQSKINEQTSIREQDLRELFALKIDSQDSEDKGSDSTRKIARETYKTLWQTSENTAKSLENMVHQLQSRLDTMTLHVIEAEKHCCNHQAKLKEIESEFNKMVRSGKVYARPEGSSRKGTEKHVAHLLLTEEELKMKKEENNLLRGFLQEVLKTKADVFNTYKMNLESAKKDYFLSLQKIKKSFKKHPEEEKDDDDDDETEAQDKP